MSCYLHHVPGRIRIEIPDIKGKPVYAQELENMSFKRTFKRAGETGEKPCTNLHR